MAKHSEFPQANTRLQPAPSGSDIVHSPDLIERDGVKISDILVYKDESQMVSCWQLDAQELLEVLRTGKVYLFILGHRHPAVHINGISPWAEPIADFGVEEAVTAEEDLLNQADPTADVTPDGAPPLPN